MRPAVALVALFVALLAVPAAVASEPADGAEECGFQTYGQVVPVAIFYVGAVIETRDCEAGRSYSIAVTQPQGRTDVQWYDDEHGVGLEVFHPPRFVSWTQTERGCWVVVYTFGADQVECGPLGPPPSPRDYPMLSLP